jgi:hypothetical protein
VTTQSAVCPRCGRDWWTGRLCPKCKKAPAPAQPSGNGGCATVVLATLLTPIAAAFLTRRAGGAR